MQLCTWLTATALGNTESSIRWHWTLIEAYQGQCYCLSLQGRKPQCSEVESLAKGHAAQMSPARLGAQDPLCTKIIVQLVASSPCQKKKKKRLIKYVRDLKSHPSHNWGSLGTGEGFPTEPLLQFSSSDLSLQSGSPSQRQPEWMHSPLRQWNSKAEQGLSPFTYLLACLFIDLFIYLCTNSF